MLSSCVRQTKPRAESELDMNIRPLPQQVVFLFLLLFQLKQDVLVVACRPQSGSRLSRAYD